jgi:hypothetical protein
MKWFLALVVGICAAFLSSSQQFPTAGGAGRAHRESAVVEFKAPVKLMSSLLRGEYLFVHDEEKMEAGEECTFVYQMVAGQPVKLVVSFHCIPVPRRRVETFTIRGSFVGTTPELYELLEYQFAGSSEGHQVPSRAEAKSATVDLVACCQ